LSRLFAFAAFFILYSIVIGLCASPGDIEYLSDLYDRVISAEQGWGVLGIDTCAHISGQTPLPIVINGISFSKGLGHHAPGEIIIDLNGEYSQFEARVGVQDQGKSVGSVVFMVFVDGIKCFDSGIMRDGDAPKPVNVSTKGASQLRLVVTDAGDGYVCDCANWADARLVRATPLKQRKGVEMFDIAKFARVVTCDPNRKSGTSAGRTQEFPADDIYLESDLPTIHGGLYTVPTSTKCVGLVWGEFRRLRKLAIKFASKADVPPLQGAQVEAWFGVTAHQGEWRRVDGQIEQSGDELIFTPKSPDGLSGIMKVRWVIPAIEKAVNVRSLSAFTPLRTSTINLSIICENPSAGSLGSVSIYNGEITKSSAKSGRWSLNKPLDLTVRYVLSAAAKIDQTVILINLPSGAFGVAVQDVIKNGYVYVKDFGVFVTQKPNGITLADYKKSIADRKTVLERVRSMPDQTFANALAKTHHLAQNSGPMMLSLACDNQKFIVHRDGVLEVMNTNVPIAEIIYNSLQQLWVMKPKLGNGGGDMSRYLAGGWLPAPVNSVTVDGIVYRQRTYVAPVKEGALPVCVAEFTAENIGEKPADASISLAFERLPGALKAVADGAVLTVDGRLRAWVRNENSLFKLSVKDSAVSASAELPAKSVGRITLIVPGFDMNADDRASIGAAESLYRDFAAYWRSIFADSMHVEIPDESLLNVILASQVHCLIASRSQDNGRLVAPWIAANTYGPLESESNSIIRGMDMLGHHDFARRSLDFFIKNYNKEGYLTTGYTLLGTGWHLWTLGEHYELTRDDGWIKQNASEIDRVCRWVAAQRKKTMKPNALGQKPPEYGLMPPGVIADWGVYAYYFSLNSYYSAGLRHAAKALAAAGFLDGAQLLAEAADFDKDILAAYRRTQSCTPVVPLQNGCYVPGYPTQVYTPGRVGDFYPGEDGNRSWAYDVEVGAHQLIPAGVLPPDGRDSEWIMNHMEDEHFLADGWFDYPAAKNHEDWFNLGGFSKVQPYYCRNAEIYAMRDDVKPFIRSYFNQLASLLNTEVLSLWEHFSASGAWNKTHETGYFLQQTKWMFVTERGGGLVLAPFVTSEWMKDGMTVAVKKAPTSFGEVGFRIHSRVRDGIIEAVVEPPTRSTPDYIAIRLRHPDGRQIKSVEVDGKVWADFDSAKSIVRLKPSAKNIEIRAHY